MGDLFESLGKDLFESFAPRVGTLLKLFFTHIFLQRFENLVPATRHWIGIGLLWMIGAALVILCVRELANAHLSFPRVPEVGLAGWRAARANVHRENAIVIPAVVLLLTAAVGSWPYNFYVFMRVAVCATAGWLGVQLHRANRYRWWEVLIFAVAVLFNPFAPFHFPKETWRAFNVLSAFAIIPGVFVWPHKLPTTADQVGIAVATPSHHHFKMSTRNRSYRYCSKCSVRVAASDSFCRRCGSTLN